MLKMCSKCGNVLELDAFNRRERAKDGRRSECRYCQSAAQHQYRKLHKEKWCMHARTYRQKYPEKKAATNAVSTALKYGKLQRGPCESCGSDGNIEAHHDDYSHALIITWLCRTCHTKLHRRIQCD